MTEDVTTKHVRALRHALGDSQARFAQRLNAGARTVARYETARAPKGRALARLAEIATSAQLPELAAAFTAALENELYGGSRATHKAMEYELTYILSNEHGTVKITATLTRENILEGGGPIVSLLSAHDTFINSKTEETQPDGAAPTQQ